MEKEYFIRIGDQDVPVTEEVYRAYKRPAWAERKRREVRAEMERSLDVFLNDGFDISSNDALVDEIVEDKLLLEMLLAALNELTDDERRLIDSLFYQEKSERELAGKTGRSKTAIHKQKEKVLNKLKNLLK